MMKSILLAAVAAAFGLSAASPGACAQGSPASTDAQRATADAASAAAAARQAAAAEAALRKPNDYADPAAWLCRPDIAHDACDVDLDATVVRADGSTSLQRFHKAAHPPIDCFYVYPTVSLDPGALATMKAEFPERNVVKQQFALLAASCRLYAPLYRQFTLTALAAAMRGHPLPQTASPLTPLSDVRDAWRWYLAHANHGRGVVLVGHSQGSGMLIALIKREIDGKPDQTRLVSAILMGANLLVPKGEDVGGDFKSIRLCHADRDTGCAIAFASFRETSPPPPNSRFGRPRSPAPGMAAACVDPAALGGGSGPLESYFPVRPAMPGMEAPAAHVWVKTKTIETPFVAVPGLLSAACVSTPEFNYLAVHVNVDPASPRVSQIEGDVVLAGKVQADWGLHLIDANLTLGNLVDVVRRQGEAWTAAHGPAAP
ncbi:MAG TPA: DUF3089 domain-containing protein [Caulobacteraceae bacterium]|jgi:hypothetical protein|nr:DUF3089 domain-containing protein [Caulobacteraceae bacterium]